jgi:hypothetical protein
MIEHGRLRSEFAMQLNKLAPAADTASTGNAERAAAYFIGK